MQLLSSFFAKVLLSGLPAWKNHQLKKPRTRTKTHASKKLGSILLFASYGRREELDRFYLLRNIKIWTALSFPKESMFAIPSRGNSCHFLRINSARGLSPRYKHKVPVFITIFSTFSSASSLLFVEASASEV